MSAPTQVLTRQLTFNFEQSVSLATGMPDVLEIAVLPLNSATDVASSTTFTGGLKTAELELSGTINSVSFDLVPTFSPGLAFPITYRVMWRAGILGRTETFDFSMPDENLTWDELLAGPGYIIDGATYLQQSDLGIPGRVAELDQNGNVVDALGNICATQVDITNVMNDLTVETINRTQADTALRTLLEGELNTQTSANLATAQTLINNTTHDLQLALSGEAALRQAGDATVTSNFQAADAHLQSEIDALDTAVTGINTTLSTAVILDPTGHISIGQIPSAAVTHWIQVPDVPHMLALQYPTQVQVGDLALTPTGVYGLIAPDPSQLSNWYLLNEVLSVNTKTGAVVLTAADVNAVPVGGSVSMSQVTGLTTALLGKTDAATTTTLQAQVNTIASDTTVVHTVSGVIPDPLMPADIALINSSGLVTDKNGNVLGGGGGTGVSTVFSVNGKTGNVLLNAHDVSAINQADLSTALATKVNTTDPSVTNARFPTPHAATHLANGTDPISISPSQVTGLSTVLYNNALTGTSNAVNRIGSLEARMSSLEISEPTGTTAQQWVVGTTYPVGATVTYGGLTYQLTAPVPAGTAPGSNPAWLQIAAPTPPPPWVNTVNYPAGSVVTYNGIAYTTTAAVPGGGSPPGTNLAWSVVTGGPGDNGPAVTTTVFYESATTTDVTSFPGNVVLHSPWGIDSDGTITGTAGTPYYLRSGVRSQDVAYPYITANGHLQLHLWNESGPPEPSYALSSDLALTTAAVATKANQADLVTLSGRVDTKAAQSDLTALQNTVATKAAQSDLNTTNTTVATKANQSDLTALTTTVGTKAAQSDLTTTNANVTALQNAMPTKADLVSGKLPLTETPQNIPMSYVSGLTPTVANLNPTTGTFDAAKLTNTAALTLGMTQVTGLSTALAGKADLVGGSIPMSEMPPGVVPNPQVVANRAAMLALTSTQVQPGDLCLITATTDIGTYVLMTPDPTQFANWAKLPEASSLAGVDSVNGYTGIVTLSYADVGAMAANATFPVSSITGLQAQLNTFAYNSGPVKHADYVSTTPIASLGGAQSVDGVVAPLGATVLLTAQSSSVNNGLWVTSASTWTRPADFATGSFVAKDTIVIVSNTTTAAGGATNPYTVWQMTDPGGNIDTATNRWARIGWVAPPFVPVQGNGIAVSGSTIAVAPATGGGILVGPTGISVDPNAVVKKAILPVPAGSTTPTLVHNLNTLRPDVSIWDVGSNTLVIAGITVVDSNTISIEFGVAPASGQYVVSVYG
jgi:hypothetical protein